MNKNLTAYLLEKQESALQEIKNAKCLMSTWEIKTINMESSIDYLISATETLAYVIENILKYGDTDD